MSILRGDALKSRSAQFVVLCAVTPRILHTRLSTPNRTGGIERAVAGAAVSPWPCTALVAICHVGRATARQISIRTYLGSLVRSHPANLFNSRRIMYRSVPAYGGVVDKNWVPT